MGKSEDAFTVEVLNWGKYNERKDVKRGAPWFKVDTNLFADAFIQKLTPGQFKVWFYLLSECSKRSVNVLKLSRKCTVRVLGLRWKCIETALRMFETDLKLSWKRTDGKTLPNNDGDLSDSHVTCSDTSPLLQSRVEKSRVEKSRVEYINPEAAAYGDPTATELKTSRQPKEKPSEFDFEIADAWHSHALTVTPNKKCNRDREADAVRMLRSVDGYPEADIRAVLAFVKRDSFWSNNALSPCGLRVTKPGGVRKIENIVASMKRKPSGPASLSKASQDEQKRTVFDVLDEVGA